MLNWRDNSPNATNINAEAGFVIERAAVVNGVVGTFINLGAVGANVKTFTDSAVQPSSRYAYRVSAFNAGLSVPSNEAQVTAPMIPIPLSPEGVGASANPAFTFVAAPGATHYRLILWSSVGGTTTYGPWYTAAQAGAPSGTGNGTLQWSSSLSPGPRYAWAVQAKSAALNPLPSPWLGFQVGTKPGQPTPLTPTGNLVGMVSNFTFSAVSGAETYLISDWTAAKGWQPVIMFTAAQAGVGGGVGTGNILVTPVITNASSHAWSIVASNSSGLGPISASLAYRIVGPAAPTQITAANSTTSSFQFTSAPGATDYQITLFNASSVSLPQGWLPAASVVSGGTGTITLTGVSPGRYRWAVTAKSGVIPGTASVWRWVNVP